MSKELPEGHTCIDCGEFHKWPAYVYAHAHIELTHTCSCGKEVLIWNYKVIPIKKK